MADFIVDFEELYRQLSRAVLTKEQTQKLWEILKVKDTAANSGLTKEEQSLYQCCREYRSYNHDKDTDCIVCPKCGSVATIKHGRRNGRQRYICKDCGRSFGDTNGTVVYRSKLSANKWIRLIKMTLQGEGTRSIAINLHISKNTVLYNRHRICSVIQELVCNQDNFRSLAEGDEFYYPLSFKDKKDPDFFLKTLRRMPYTHCSQADREEYVTNAGYDLSMLEQYKENRKDFRLELKNYVSSEDLESQEKFSNAVNAMEVDDRADILKLLKEHLKKKKGISNQQVCCLTCVDTAGNQFMQTVCVGRVEARHIEENLVPHFTEDTFLVTDSHRAYKTVANRNNIPLRQIPSGKHTSGGYHLGHVDGYHRNVREYLHRYYGVSSKYLDLYLALAYWREKNRGRPYLDQAYDIMTLLANQVNKISLHKFKEKTISFDLKGILGKNQGFTPAI